MECFVCFETFNSKNLKPLLLPCGHTTCTQCLQRIINSTRRCPNGCEKSENLNEDITSFTVNFALLQMTEDIELHCSYHTEKLAIFINLSIAEAYCEVCCIEKNNGLLVSIENFSKSLNKTLNGLIGEPGLDENMKNRIKNCKRLTNKQKFCLLKEIKIRVDRLVCKNHYDVDAIAFDFKNHLLLCSDCIGQKEFFIKMLDTEDFQKEIISRIIWDQRSSNLNSIAHTISKLKGMSLKDLIISLKFKSTEPKPVFNSKSCSRCQSSYDLSNPPYVFPCPGPHMICSKCANNEKVDCPFNHGSSFSKSDLEPFFSDTNRIACCELCKNPFNLIEKMPKVLPCSHILCLSCLNSLPLSQKKCPKCSNPFAEQYRSLPSSQFLIQKHQKNTIFCSRHKNLFAQNLDLVSLRAFCKKCENHENIKLIPLENSNSSIFSVARGLINSLNLDFESFESLQGLFDDLVSLQSPSTKGSLRSNLPKGKVLEDRPHPNWHSSHSFAFRFFSVMPTKEVVTGYEFITSPWVVDALQGQVEAISFKVDSEVTLIGVLLGQVVNEAQARTDLIKIVEGRGLNGKEIYLNDNNFPFTREPGFEYQNIIFSKNVKILPNFFYSILVRIRGEGVLVNRGNPFDLKENVLGSDGVRFEFEEVENIGDFYLNGQHHITGPILGMIYQ